MNIDKILVDAIRSNGNILLTVHGNSMYPTIKDNQKVIVSLIEKISIGDIVAYKSDEKHTERISRGDFG